MPAEKHHSSNIIFSNEYGQVTQGGSFEGDHAMPLFSNNEFNAAFVYLDLKMDIEQARGLGQSRMNLGGKDVPLAMAEKECARRKQAFKETVREETLRRTPQADEETILRRERDILAAQEDTAYIAPEQGFRR